MIKKHITKILLFMLAITLAFSSVPLTTYATEGGVGDTVGNTGGGDGSMSYSSSSLAWSNGRQGYRLYIIDKNFVRISPVYDFYYADPQTDGVGTWCFTTRFDGSYTPTTGNRLEPISTLQSWCNSDKKVPTPTKLVSGNRVGNGQEFKEWFFNGKEGNSIFTSTPGGTITGGGTDSGSNSNNTTVNNELVPGIKDESSAYDIMDDASVAYNWYNTTLSSTYIYNEDDLISGGISLWLQPHTDTYYLTRIYLDQYINDYYEYILLNVNDAMDMEPGYIQKCLIALFYKNNKGNYTHCSCAITGKYCDNLDYHGFVNACRDVYRDAQSYGAVGKLPASPDLLTQSIPLAGTDPTAPTGGGAGMPAYELLQSTNTIKVSGCTVPFKALADGGYLVVEPITWLYVRTNPTAPWDSPSTYESTRTYGTYWNLASKWVGTGGFYNTIMTKLFNNCLAISRTVTSPTGKTLQGIESTNQKSVADSLNYMNAGYGLSMHISKIHN